MFVLDLRDQLFSPSHPLQVEGRASGRAVPRDDADFRADGPFFDFVNEWTSYLFLKVKRGDLPPFLLVLDETDLCIKKGGNAPPGLVRIVMQGRAHGISYAFGTRRWTEIPPVVREMVDETFLFNMDGQRSLKQAREEGFDDEAVSQLQVGEFYHKRRREGTPHFHRGLTSPCEG